MSAPASADAKNTMRMIVSSFAAGVSLMVFAGLVAPTIVQGGLSLTAANASTIEAQAPVLELDVEAVRAQLADADREMAAARASTDDDMARLQQLAR